MSRLLMGKAEGSAVAVRTALTGGTLLASPHLRGSRHPVLLNNKQPVPRCAREKLCSSLSSRRPGSLHGCPTRLPPRTTRVSPAPPHRRAGALQGLPRSVARTSPGSPQREMRRSEPAQPPAPRRRQPRLLKAHPQRQRPPRPRRERGRLRQRGSREAAASHARLRAPRGRCQAKG